MLSSSVKGESGGTSDLFAHLGCRIISVPFNALDSAGNSSVIIDISSQALTNVAGVDKHVGPANRSSHHAAIGGKVQILTGRTDHLTAFGGRVQLEPFFTSAPGMNSVPILPEQTNRLLALPGYIVEDGVGRVAAAGIVDGVVRLILVAFVYACFVGEVVDLPALADSIER